MPSKKKSEVDIYRPRWGVCPACGAGDNAWCTPAECWLIDPLDFR